MQSVGGLLEDLESAVHLGEPLIVQDVGRNPVVVEFPPVQHTLGECFVLAQPINGLGPVLCGRLIVISLRSSLFLARPPR